jgi:hypothetical protein
MLALSSWLGWYGTARSSTPTDDPARKTVSVGLSYSSRAEYIEDPSPNAELRTSLGYIWNDQHAFGLSGGVRYRNQPYEEIYGTDVELSYGSARSVFNSSSASGLEWKPFASLSLGTSKASSADYKRLGLFTAGLNLAWSPLASVTFDTSTGASVYAHRETLNEFGEANQTHSLFGGIGGTLDLEILTLSQSIVFYQTSYDEGWEDTYDFSSTTSLATSVAKAYKLSIGVTTSDKQLRYGRNMNFKMYDRDITRFTLSITTRVI